MIVIRFPTIMDGPVVRWYMSMSAAHNGTDVISASRNRVYAHGDITPELFNAAWEIHQRLKADDKAPTADVVTHTKGLFGGDIRPVVEVQA